MSVQFVGEVEMKNASDAEASIGNKYGPHNKSQVDEFDTPTIAR
jgi:hypothetical protein